ncbi:hypothetical protein NH340_JMT05681 [Sarcoptes scabiei]|nr:hypothetical protein NH340_JMT05681 [Sarcoptes scabiei]
MYNIQNEAIKILKDRNFQYESMKFYSSESQARSNVNELENPYLTEMNTIKCFYVLFTTIIHWQFQNFFQ